MQPRLLEQRIQAFLFTGEHFFDRLQTGCRETGGDGTAAFRGQCLVERQRGNLQFGSVPDWRRVRREQLADGIVPAISGDIFGQLI